MKFFFKVLLIIFIAVISFNPTENIASEKIYKIAFAYFGPDPGSDLVMEGYLEGLKEQGFIEGKNLKVDKFHASGEISNISQMMQTVNYRQYDILIPMSTPCLSGALASIKKTKIVFAYTYDPIAAGAGKSFDDHLPNLTGVGSFPPLEDTFDLIQKILPNVKRIGIIYNASEANSVKVVEVGGKSLKKRGITLVETTVTNTNEILQAAQSLVLKDVQAVWISGDNTIIQGLEGVIKPVNKAKIPLFMNDIEFLERGAFAAIGISWKNTGIAASKLAARVLKGEDPKNIPIENVAVKRIVLNGKVAKQLNISLSSEVLKDVEIIK
ncbi:MAG: ABC transporter substrate-binding protein [Desulfobacterales bacterium]|nr:ABC transporter substrate-binding protein [Desulfobacterales bacterium]MBF0397847.1 ABC transporter substrate-binding protein [Desulfobacterales bacterium]